MLKKNLPFQNYPGLSNARLFTRSNFRSCIDFYKRFSYYTLFVDTGQLFSSLFTPFSHDFVVMRVFHSCVICSRSSTSAWLFSSRSIFSFEFLRRGV